MRTAYAFGIAAFLAASPAMAQVTFGTGDYDAPRHEQRSQQERMEAQHEIMRSHRDARMGDYRAAERDRRDAHEDWRDAHHQDRAADRDRDNRNGFNVQIR
jgi:hypothetical protein